MKFNRSVFTMMLGVSLLVLTSCAGDKAAQVKTTAPTSAAPSGNTSSAPAEPAVSAPTVSAPAVSAPTEADGVSQHGGQVVEVGEYHLELVPLPEAQGAHLDLFLLKGEGHEAIPTAKVTAQVELPDGTQQSLEMPYDAEGGHYAALLASSAPGEYKVAVLSDIGGEKINGRFSFNQ
jgi:hypothetical protein